MGVKSMNLDLKIDEDMGVKRPNLDVKIDEECYGCKKLQPCETNNLAVTNLL